MKKLILMFIISACVIAYAGESRESIIAYDLVNMVADKVIECESNGRQIIWGDCDKNIPKPYYCTTLSCARKYHCKAYGVAQFWKKTFVWLAGLTGRPELKMESEQDQRWLLTWSIRNGYGKNWTCFRKES